MSRLDAFRIVPSGATVAASNSGGTGTSVPLTPGSYTALSYCAHLQAQLNATRTPANWTVSLSLTTGLVTIDCVGETWALTFTTAAAGTAIGFAGNIASTSDPATGAAVAPGFWRPNCPLQLQGDPISAPEVTTVRSVETPTGATETLGGSCKYEHRGLRWSHVTRDRVQEGAATTPGMSFQQWLRDTQWGRGHSWFRPGSRFQIYWSSSAGDAIVGADLNAGAGPTNGWTCSPAISKLEQCVKRVDESWLEMLSVTIDRVTSNG